MSILDQFSLAGKTALVTGCRRGIGRGIAEALAQAGANIIGVSASLEPSAAILKKRSRLWDRNLPPIQLIFQIAQR